MCTLLHELLEDAGVLPAMWNVGFAMVDEREKDRMHKELDELGALVSKLPLGGDEMSVETYIRMEGGGDY